MSPDHALSCRAGPSGEPLRRDNAQLGVRYARKPGRRSSPPGETAQAHPRAKTTNGKAMTTQADDEQAPLHDTGSDDRIREEIEPELGRFVERSKRTRFSRLDTIEARWRASRSEPIPRLNGDALLARTEQRLHAFCQGDRYGYDASVRWPMTEAQRDAIREAAEARTGAERLRAIAALIEVSPYFDWFASTEALCRRRDVDEAEGKYFGERAYRAFDRPDLDPGTYTKVNVGLIGPRSQGFPDPPRMAVCADPKGWAAVLWGHERNRWSWEDYPYDLFVERLLSDAPQDRAFMRDYHAKEESREWVGVTFPAVGVSSFTSLSEVDGGMALNAAAARLLELDEAQVQWLGASAWEGGPYWDTHVGEQDLAEVSRAVAGGEDARDAWYARRIPGLDVGCDGGWRQSEEDRAREREASRGPELSGRLSVLIEQALDVVRRLDPGVYRPNARVLHRWSPTLERCELDVAGLLLAGPIGLDPRASADEVWLHVVDNPRTRKALRALRQAGMGEVDKAVVTLGCFQHRDLLESMTVEPPGYDGWREAEAHFTSLEELGRQLKALGL